MTEPDRSGRQEFQDRDVVGAYVHRADYPAALYERLLALMPKAGRVLDLGCGPGKIARALAPRVIEVLAVDPSPAMLRLGRELDGGRNTNIRWIEAKAEDLEPPAVSFDLAVAGAAIHWMEPDHVFPKLAAALAPGAGLALVDGDGPAAAPWREAYQAVIVSWVERLGGAWNGEAHRSLVAAHDPWFDVEAQETFTATVGQPLEALVAGEHSRATWSRARMGRERAEAFDDDLREVLTPWADDGWVSFEVRSSLVWGRPRRTARGAP